MQADEVIHEDNVGVIKKLGNSNHFNSFSFKFYHFIRSWEPSRDGYGEAIRMITKGKGIKLKGDGWDFEGDIYPMCPSFSFPKPIYHFAWCFPKSDDIKDIEHAKIYANIPEYQEKMKKACSNIREEKQAYPIGNFDDFPKLARRFVGQKEYVLP